jgi:hypothetical protein
MGRWADALITTAGPRDHVRAVVDAFRDGGGEGKPLFLQVALSFAPTDAEAEEAACDQWRFCALPSDRLADIATPADFDRESDRVPASEVLARVRASADIGRQVAWLQEDAAMGFDRLYLHNVARAHQERFIDAYGTRLIPALTA